MSKKDVLHIPPSPPAPRREAGTGEERTSRHEPPIMTPDSGPDGTPAVRGTPRVIEPQGKPGRYPGVSVS
jgi:hypothetical protein